MNSPTNFPIETHGARAGMCSVCDAPVTRLHGVISPWIDERGSAACSKGYRHVVRRPRTCGDCGATKSHEWWSGVVLGREITLCTTCAAHRDETSEDHIEWTQV